MRAANELIMSLSEIKIEGNEWEIDSFSACIAVVMKFWQRDYTYRTIAGLSGTAFSPTWWVSEDCYAWWMEYGNDERIEFIGKALGFTVRESPDMDFNDYKEKNIIPDEVTAFWDEVKIAVENEDPVLIRTWPTWSIITGWDDEIEKIRLATVEGAVGEICKPYPFSKIYILTGGPIEMTRMDAYREAIIFGADIADGTYKLEDYKYGGALYDAILKAMAEEFFCPSCKEKSCGCVARTMCRISGTNRDAVKFFEEASEFMGGQLPGSELNKLLGKYKSLSETGGEYCSFKSVCEHWHEKEYRMGFKEKIIEMKVMHSEVAAIYRRLVGHMSLPSD